jgi:predicted small metal-binding protein
MEKKCSTEGCDFVADGATEEETEQKLQDHAKEVHSSGDATETPSLMPESSTDEEGGMGGGDKGMQENTDGNMPQAE